MVAAVLARALEPEGMSEDSPPQFGLQTLLLGMTALAVLCGVLAWSGLTGSAGVILLIVVLGTGAAALVGLVICSVSGYGSLEDLRWEVLKCLVLAAAVVLLAYRRTTPIPAPYVFFVVPAVIIIGIKLFWREAGGTEIAIVGVCLGWAAVIGVTTASNWIGD
jgi:hypothetical protein